MTNFYVSPGQNVQQAMNQLYAGDTLFFHGGTYTGAENGWYCQRSGTEQNPITITNEPGEKAVIQVTGTGIWFAPFVGNREGSGPRADCVRLVSADNGFRIQGPSWTDAPGIRIWGASHWEIAGLEIVGMGYGIFGHTYNNDHFHIHHNRIISPCREAGIQMNGPYHTIEYNEIIRDRTDYHSPHGCSHIALLGHDNVVRGNTMHYKTFMGSEPAMGVLFEWDISDRNLVEGNTIINCDRGFDFAGGDNNTVRNNTIIAGGPGSVQAGFYVRSYDGSGPLWPCQNEWLVPSSGHPAYDRYYPHNCHSMNNIIEGNVVRDYRYAVLFEGVVPSGETVIRDNHWLNCQHHICTWSRCGSFAGVLDENNTTQEPPEGEMATLHDGESHQFGDLEQGTYEVTAAVPSDWELDRVECDAASEPIANGVRLDVVGTDPGCVFFFKKKLGSVTVSVSTDPSGDPQAFELTLTKV